MRIRLAELLRRAANRLDRQPCYEITLRDNEITVSTTNVATDEAIEKLRAIHAAFLAEWRSIGRSEDG